MLPPIGVSGPLSVVCCVPWGDRHVPVMTKANQGVSRPAFPRPPAAVTPGSPCSFSSLTRFHEDSTQTSLRCFPRFVPLTLLSHLSSLSAPHGLPWWPQAVVSAHLGPHTEQPTEVLTDLSLLLSQWHAYVSSMGLEVLFSVSMWKSAF